jgi:hypothetical protein
MPSFLASFEAESTTQTAPPQRPATEAIKITVSSKIKTPNYLNRKRKDKLKIGIIK